MNVHQYSPGLDLTSSLDEEGFLSRAELWNREMARALAESEVPDGLSEDHWKVINYLREYYEDCSSVPPPKMLCRRTGLSYGQIRELFPSGLTKGACRIAGIPRATIRPGFFYP
jgi:dissimilatory sulfite reductase related protein